MQHNDQSWEEDSVNQFQVDREFEFMADDASSPTSTSLMNDNQFVQYNKTGSKILLSLVGDLSGSDNEIFNFNPARISVK